MTFIQKCEDFYFLDSMYVCMKCATKSLLQKTLRKWFLKNQLDNSKKTKHSKVTYFCIVYASTHILTNPILGTT